MTDAEIEVLTMKEMRELEQRLNAARFTRARKLWTEINGKTKTTIGQFVKFRDEQEALGR